jgi:hypothetical protein
MMLAKHNVIDLVASSNDKSKYVLVLVVEAGEWSLDDYLWLLQEKLNAYAAYALDGPLHKQCPDSVGKPVTIVVRPVDPMPDDAHILVAQVAAILAQDGLTVTVEPLPAAEAA